MVSIIQIDAQSIRFSNNANNKNEKLFNITSPCSWLQWTKGGVDEYDRNDNTVPGTVRKRGGSDLLGLWSSQQREQ